MSTSTTSTLAARAETRGLVLQAIFRFVLGMGIPAAILFISAGRLDWVKGWVYIGALTLCVSTNLFILISTNPEVVAERLHREKDLKSWDKVVTSLMSVFWFFAMLVAGLDQRFQWSSAISSWLSVVAVLVMVLGDALFLWAMAVNKFFSKFVRIQRERGHHAVTTGPYRYVRHPGYVGWSMMAIAPPLILGSRWALVPAALAICCMIVRTALEDRTLHEELHGYKEYAQQVRYRLLPGVW